MNAVEYTGYAAAVRPVEKDGSTGASKASAGDGWVQATLNRIHREARLR